MKCVCAGFNGIALRRPHKNKFALVKVANVDLWLFYDGNIWISPLSQTDIFPVRESFKVQITKQHSNVTNVITV